MLKQFLLTFTFVLTSVISSTAMMEDPPEPTVDHSGIEITDLTHVSHLTYTHHGLRETREGFKVRLRSTIPFNEGFKGFKDDYVPTTDAKECILIVPGRAGFAEQYEFFTRERNKEKYHVAVLDLPCQGGSTCLAKDKHMGYVDTYETYAVGLYHAIRQLYGLTGKPVKLVVHSMAAAALLVCLRDYSDDLVHCIKDITVVAPMIKFYPVGYPDWLARAVVAANVALGRGETYALSQNPLNPEILWKSKVTKGHEFDLIDKEGQIERYINTLKHFREVTLGGPTNGWVHQSYIANDSSWKISLPILRKFAWKVVLASRDTIICNKAAREFFERLGTSHCSIETLDSRHHPFFAKDAIRRQLHGIIARDPASRKLATLWRTWMFVSKLIRGAPTPVHDAENDQSDAGKEEA